MTNLREIIVSGSNIALGKQGENNATKICLPKKEFELFSGGTFSLLAQRETDAAPYPVVITDDDNYVYWSVSSSDTAIAGVGTAELRLTIGTTIVKSITYTTYTIEAIGDGSTPPAPYVSWVTSVLAAADAIENMSATASVSNTIGTPSVVVTKTTVSGHENFDFAFSNIKGAKGDAGSLGSVTASVDGNTGTPSVVVTYDGNNADFAFKNLKGATGQQGQRGQDGAKGDDGVSVTSATINGNGHLIITLSNGNTIDCGVAKGSDGQAGANGKSAYQYAVDGGYTGTEQQFTSDLVAISSKYTFPNGGIPKTDLANGVKSSLDKADTALQEHQSLSAYRTSSAQDIIDNAKKDKPLIKTTMDAVATVNTEYYLGTQTSVSVTLPSTASAGQSISVVFYSGSTATTLTVSGTYLGTVPTPSTNQRVELNLLYDGSYWCLLSNVVAVSA